MAKVRINDDRYAELQEYVNKAMTALEDAMDIWGTNFDNLYHNFVTNGFLDKLYKDAESNYKTWSKGLSAVSNVVSGAALGCTIGSVIPGIGNIAGAIIGAVIGAVCGVFSFCKGDPEWITVSKEVLIQMLENCRVGNDDAYIYMANMYAKILNSIIALERVRTRINDFNFYGADFVESAKNYDLSVRTSGADGLTIMGVETEVVIDGETITMDTSEAMSAFYTYAYTVTSSVIAADYLERTYGYDIDFLGLVANANAFMADTIESDMYTSEMIELILPSFSPDENAAYAAASAATGLDQSELQAALGDVAALGVNPLFAGLIGAGFMGDIGGTVSTSAPSTGTPPTIAPSTTTPTTPSTTTPITTPPTTTGPTGGGGGGTTPPTGDPSITFDPFVETEIPLDQDVKVEIGVDYDQLAYEEYQFENGSAAIEEYRLGLMEDVEAKYAAGEFGALTDQLKGYGYTTAQIATILGNKSMTITAVLDGSTRNILSERAAEMAQADGVEGYDSKFNDSPTMTDLADTSKPLKTLHVNSDNKELVEMEKNLDSLEDNYRDKVGEANSLLDQAAADKQSVDTLKTKYEKEYGTDTSSWSEEAVKSYDTAVDKYNVSAEAANTAIKAANDAKVNYQNSRTEFEKACEDYYLSKVASAGESSSAPTTSAPTTSPVYTGDVTDQGGFLINQDGTVSFGTSTDNSVVDTSTSSNSTVGNVSSNGSSTYISQDDFLASLGLKSDKDNN